MATSVLPQKRNREIRPELNLEQWQIWLPAKSKLKPEPRLLEKRIKTNSGKIIQASVEIGLSYRGTLTTEDQKTYYALIELWEQFKNKKNDFVHFSLKGLLRTLGKSWGTRNIETVKDSLSRLYGVSFIWQFAYIESSNKEAVESLEGFRILSKLKIITRKTDGHITRAEGYFRFDDNLLVNLKNRFTRPVLFDVYLSFKSEIAQLIYSLLDRVLAVKKFTYQKRTAELFRELGLEGKSYQQRSNRKQVLEKAIQELIGLPMSNGAFLEVARIEETTDKKDFKLVARRSRIVKNLHQSPNIPPKTVESNNNAQSNRNKNQSDSFEPNSFAEKLICKFERKILELEPQQPKSQHIKIIDEWVQEFGESGAEAILEDVIGQLYPTREKYHSFGIVKELSRKSITKIKKKQEKIQQEDFQKKEQEDFQLAKQIFRTFPEAKQTKLRRKYERKFKKIHKLTQKDFDKKPYLEADMSNYAGEQIQREVVAEYTKEEIDTK